MNMSGVDAAVISIYNVGETEQANTDVRATLAQFQ
jgi:hypothetical protein